MRRDYIILSLILLVTTTTAIFTCKIYLLQYLSGMLYKNITFFVSALLLNFALFKGLKDIVEFTRGLKDRRSETIISKKLRFGLFDKETIHHSVKYYLRPKCADLDPSNEESMRHALTALRVDLFNEIDDFINVKHGFKHLLLLADSGTGKTSFAINYFAYNEIKLFNKAVIAIVPLSLSDAEDLIFNINNKNDVVLILDALDEDIKARDNCIERINYLMQKCYHFKRVLVTCRTQFFHNDGEIPVKTGVVVIKPRAIGEKGVYEFRKVYLSPFDDKEIKKYISKRYKLHEFKEKREAIALAHRIPDLAVRPMLMSYIPDLLKCRSNVTYIYQLYEVIVNEWLERESSWVDKNNMREFSDRLAINMFVNAQHRKSERIHFEELEPLASKWGIDLASWQVSGRSLLNRDSIGNYKFAHRSIMEFLFVVKLLSGDSDCFGVTLTDQMLKFIFDILEQRNNLYLSNRLKHLMLSARIKIVNESSKDYDDNLTCFCKLLSKDEMVPPNYIFDVYSVNVLSVEAVVNSAEMVKSPFGIILANIYEAYTEDTTTFKEMASLAYYVGSGTINLNIFELSQEVLQMLSLTTDANIEMINNNNNMTSYRISMPIEINQKEFGHFVLVFLETVKMCFRTNNLSTGSPIKLYSYISKYGVEMLGSLTELNRSNIISIYPTNIENTDFVLELSNTVTNY